MSPLHIAAITFDWYPFHLRVRRLAEAAVDAGYEVDVICLRQSHEKRYEVYNGVYIYRMPMNRSFGPSLPVAILSWCWFMLLAGVTLTRLHLRHPYDVIHVHNMPDFLVFSTLLPKLLGAKIILDVQDVSPELIAAKAQGPLRELLRHLAMWEERFSTAFSDHVVTVGWPFEELLLQRGVAKKKLTNILNSADPKIFPPISRQPVPIESNKDARPFSIMYHGNLAKRNGLDTAIRALALARRTVPHLRLDIRGWGEEWPVLQQLAVDLEVGDHVVFSSAGPAEELADFILHGDVGIIPYQCDGFMELVLPTKAYEFAWMRRPIIASDTRALRAMFRPESIVLCDSTKPESFAEAIIDLYHHPEKRAQLVANAAQDYKPYRWEREAERYIQLLAFLARKPLQERRPIVSGKI